MKSGFISIVGRPNVGKSTLLNRLVGQKMAIVTEKPQTTRNCILAIANTSNAQMIFFDTPGIHKPRHRMNELMVQAAIQSLKKVDLVLLTIDITQPFGKGDEHVLKNFQKVKAPVLLAINKMDVVEKTKVLPVIDDYRKRYGFEEIVPISALSGENVGRLVEVLEAHLPNGERLYPEDTLTDLPERFFVSEMIREKIFQLTREEVPYFTAVRIDVWKDGIKLTRIEASILVERDSQKGIVVGKGGEMLKQIGSSARKDIEEFLGMKVFLGLHVKVRSQWRENQGLLFEMGIQPRSISGRTES